MTYELVGVDRHGFVRGSADQRVYTPEELADHVLASYMDAAERHGRR